MAMDIGILIVSTGFFILVIAISFEIFLNAWKRLPDTFKIALVGKLETPDPSQASQDKPAYLPTQDKPAYLPTQDKPKPPYLWEARLDAMQRDLDRIHCELKALESRIDNRKD